MKTASLYTVEVSSLWKRFGDKDVVKNVSLSLEPSQILGLVGPNGAGKTTTIRMILDIIRPDRGAVTLLGEKLSQDTRQQIGYLPEERGLYRGLRTIKMLTYLGELKGMNKRDAIQNADDLLEMLNMSPHRSKKIGELSRGMAQLIQFAATIIHRPKVVILDEPFAGLDPINVRLIKDVISDLRKEGASVILSTHQMYQVEEMCDQIVMIDNGTIVLEGILHEIKQRFRGDNLLIECDSFPDDLEGVVDLRQQGKAFVMRMLPGTTPESVLRQLLEKGSSIERFEVETPSMEDIFVNVVRSRSD